MICSFSTLRIYNLVYGYNSYLLQLQGIQEDEPNNTRKIRIQLPLMSITPFFRTHGQAFYIMAPS